MSERPLTDEPRSQSLTRIERSCRGGAWVESTSFDCLGFTWSLRANDTSVVDHVSDLYAACATSGQPTHRFLYRRRGAGGEPRATLYRNGQAVLRGRSPLVAVARLAWEVNRGVVDATTDRLLLHAAAAESDGAAVLLPGREGAGKSTLVAALVAAGLGYVTDETVAVDPADSTIAPYPKPIALDRGSWGLLPDLKPAVDPAWGPADQWLVAPQAIRPDAVAPGTFLPSLVLFLVRRTGRGAEARPIPRADAAVALADQSFNFRSAGPGALDTVADVVRRSRCYELDVDDLPSACRVVFDLLEQAS